MPASVTRVLDGLTAPAFAFDARQDIVGSNRLARAMFRPIFDDERPNLARFAFLDSRAREFYDDWELACSLTAAMLRYEAGRDPLDDGVTAIIGELSTRSPEFRVLWARQDVHEHRTGTKVYHHPEVGEVAPDFDVMSPPGAPQISITVFTAEPGTPSAERLALLASWAASEDE